MAESLCSYCKLLGKPPARVNFIIATGQTDSLVYPRIRSLLKSYAEISVLQNDIRLTNYETLMNINHQLFDRQNGSSSVEQAITAVIKRCDHRFDVIPLEIDDISNASQLNTFKSDIRDKLDAKNDQVAEEQDAKSEPATWIVISNSMCLEPELLNVFVQLRDENPSLSPFSLTILCFLVNEQQLFQNWFFRNLPIDDYQSNAYPKYERQIKKFFSLLDSSPYFQQNTLLINEADVSTDDSLQALSQNIYRNGLPKHRASNANLRHDMAKLLVHRRRTMHDVKYVSKSLPKYYHQMVENRLQPLFSNLKQPTTDAATAAARQVTNVILDEFGRMNDEEKRIYKQKLMLGFQDNDVEYANTIAAQLVHYVLNLLKNDAHTSIPFIYSIILALCRLGTHFYFRHQLFNNTPEIYTLSLLLISQRQYALTLSGLRLCATILSSDRIEHKYALAYWKHDTSSVRKILDAIKWLLSPYITLKNLWKEYEKGSNDDSESNEAESTLYKAEKFCLRHAGILVERSHIRSLASLFYGSADHCAQMTEDDVHDLVEVIHVLSDRRMVNPFLVEGKHNCSVILLTELCTLLTPIFFYGLPSVQLALLQGHDLLIDIPNAILCFLRSRITSSTKDMINTCVQFYTQLIQSIYKQPDSIADEENEDRSEESNVKTSDENIIDLPTPLDPSPDLISSYYDLYKQIGEMFKSDKKSEQQEQIQKLLKEEWTKLDTVRLQHDYEQLKHEHTSLKEELSQVQGELERTQSEKDEFRKENTRLLQEIDRLKQTPATIVIAEPQPTMNIVSTGGNDQEDTVEDLANLSPHEITRTQAERCIRQICRERQTFNKSYMRNSLCGALKLLGSDLYSSPVHFLHELIQNAEDNFYDNTVTPCLRIELDHSYILLSNNEKGLRTQDVLAMCNLAVSTKTLQQEQIGEKGVGFKSVFAASNQPMLVSNAWRFRFLVSSLDAMSYITPWWLTDQDIPDCVSNQISTHPQDTYLYLPLKLQTHTSEVELFLEQVRTAVDPCILLNMRHLKVLEIVDKRKGETTLIERQHIGPTKLKEQAVVTFEDFSFIGLAGSVIKLCISSEFRTFRVYTCYVDVPTSIEQQRSPRTRLILAFPCENGYPLTSTVYTGLPVCDLGFNFLFNADFQLVTNRESVRESVPFNKFIRDHLAALFVYLILNDNDLTKDIHQYYPSENIHQLKHSSWWLIMIDNIRKLVKKYFSVLCGTQAGKASRLSNTDLTSLVSKEQLYDCADIRVIDSDVSFLTDEQLKSLQIQPVSIVDVLNCFPNREESVTTNASRQQFRSWVEKQDEQWWSELFRHISQTMTPTVANTMLQKPIFLDNDRQRQYLPKSDDRRLLFISDDRSFRMWKRQFTLLQYSSEFERTALQDSSHVQLLTDERMIEIIRQDHIELANTFSNTNFDLKLIAEIWRDLFYLKSHMDKLGKPIPFVIPVDGTPNWTTIQEAILPTIFGVDIRSLICSTTSPIIHFPYYNTNNHHHFIDILQWEHFLLEMNCQRPSICLPQNYTITELPLLPSFTKFTDEKCAQMAESILFSHTENTKDCVRQFPIIDDSKDQSQVAPVSATFDETIIHDLPSLPRITIPSHCHALAIHLGVCVEYDLRTCVTILQLLSNEKNTNVDLYIEWLSRLQLYIRQRNDFDSKNLLASCELYLPDQQDFCSLTNLLVVPDNEEYRNSILLVAKYLKLHWISPTNNQIYWPFKELFRLLGCTCAINIDHIYNTIYQASQDKSNFFALGDCNSLLTENGMEKMIILFQYLEDLILKCVKKNTENQDLYHAVVENKRPEAPCGSREDLEWRFSLTCNSLSKKLQNITGIQFQEKKISLPTIGKRLISKTTENIVYGCLEMITAQTLSKDIGKRQFISPLIARTCPLVLAIFEIDYVERRSKVEWGHKNRNMEHKLSQLTEIFRRAAEDSALEVITAKYAHVTLFLSDSFIINSSDGQDEDEINRYTVETNYPFWIFNKTVLLCVGIEKSDTAKAITATSALATLLHKRKHLPFEEAKSIAQQKISECTEFRSENIAGVAGAQSTIYSYIDLIFPTNHHSVESMTIPIGKYCTIEQDPEDEKTNNEVLADQVIGSRIAEDQVYRNRVQAQDHRSPNNNTTKNWIDPSIVDGQKNILIGQNAEHFFFVYLQRHYGSVNVTPTKNWRSSARLSVYPKYRRNINDAAGFDLELHDTLEIFTRGSKSTTKTCYFEIKGTSGSYNEEHTRFHVSQNELKMCQAIETNENKKEHEAYFIVIIQNCLDPEKISLGTVINWSSNFDMIYKTVDSYQCKINSSPPRTSENSRRKEATDYKNHQQQSRRSTNSNHRNNYPMAQSTTASNYESEAPYYTPHYYGYQQQQQQQPMNSNYGYSDYTEQYASTSDYGSEALYYTPHYYGYQQQQSMNSNYGYNDYTTQYASTNGGNPAFGQYNRFYDQNQHRQGQIFPSRPRREQ